MKLVPENSLSAMSRFILDIATPCFILTNMPRTISRETLGEYWHFPVLAFLLIGFSDLIGLGASRLWAARGERATFRFITAMPNWMFLGMAVIEPLFGIPGVRVVLLFNFSVTIHIWTLGMTGFRRGLGGSVIKELFLNSQVIATMVGTILGLTIPFLAEVRGMATERLASLPTHLGLVTAAWETAELLGVTALPLSIFQIGLRLGGPQSVAVREKTAGNRSLVIASVVRLLVSPVASIAVLALCFRLGLGMSEAEFVSAAIIMSLPTAVVALAIAEVYGGSTLLAARGILWMTVASMATVPLMTKFAQAAYARL
ncbi:MAG: AEC family transporter [Planctomycetota bacterium]|nr:AEC family transporter [Planctomycetota bacterium]